MKKSLFIIFYAIFCIGLLELGSAVLYLVHFKSWYSYQGQLEKVSVVASGNHAKNAAEVKNPRVKLPYPLHPYIGFTGRPRVPSTNKVFNDYGFLGENPVTHTKPNQLLVAITGGSVASGVFVFAEDVLRKELARAYPGKEVIITSIALGGMKQPQQLMAMNYFLVLGAKFDAIINLDGYNEIVLALQNYNTGVAPFFPRLWRLYAQKSLDVDRALLIAELAGLAKERESLANLAKLPVLNSSIFIGTLWQLLHDRKQQQIIHYEKALSEYKVSRRDSPQVAGPVIDYGDTADVENLVVDIWENSSRQMARLAEANNVEYFHFLQPNQYHEESKPLSEEEKSLLLISDHGEGDIVRNMYPKLVARIEAIQQQGGIQIFDLTQIYNDNYETLYSDNCCHLNQRGYQLMASAIADRIASTKKETSE